jgi:hypothetical protein
VVSRAWRALDAEIGHWRQAGRTVDFWWRDDDAAALDAALARLLALAERAHVPLALAVVAETADPQLLAGLGPGVAVLQHGADHRNRAAPGQKKSEFPGSEPAAAAIGRLAAARERLSALAGRRWVAALAPPWNRLHPGLVPLLPGAGFRGLSRYGARDAAAAADGLRQVNTHVDIVDWRGTRGFAGEEPVLQRAVDHLEAKRSGRADPAEPTGWLTHHARHDEAAWRFLERLFESTSAAPGVRWRAAEELFPDPSAH